MKFRRGFSIGSYFDYSVVPNANRDGKCRCGVWIMRHDMYAWNPITRVALCLGCYKTMGEATRIAEAREAQEWGS